MNNRLDLTQPGGLYAYQDTLKFMQDAYASNFDAVAKFIGDKIIVQGVVDDGSDVTAGWIVVAGELIPFIGGAKQDMILIEDVQANELFDDGVERPVYFTKTARMVNAGGDFNFIDLRKLPYSSATINDAFNNIKDLLKNFINIEPAVIIKGMKPVNELLWTLGNAKFSSGTAMFDGTPVNFIAYDGAFPVYATEKGQWTTVLPVSGLYITFDPYTSQYFTDVKRRHDTLPGKIEMYNVLLNRFELDTGLGKWEFLGWKICDEIQDRVPLGFDRRVSNPDGGEVWDVNYTNVGNTGGEKKHTLTIPEMPEHGHIQALGVISQDTPDWVNSGGAGSNMYGGASVPTGLSGGGQAFPLLQPYRVFLYVEKM